MHIKLSEINEFRSEGKDIRNHFPSLCDNNGISTKMFLEPVKPFISEGSHGNENYTLLENGRLIEDHREISEILMIIILM